MTGAHTGELYCPVSWEGVRCHSARKGHNVASSSLVVSSVFVWVMLYPLAFLLSSRLRGRYVVARATCTLRVARCNARVSSLSPSLCLSLGHYVVALSYFIPFSLLVLLPLSRLIAHGLVVPALVCLVSPSLSAAV